MSLEFFSGCVGGAAGVVVGHPLDTIKVRLQTQDGSNPKYRGTWHCLTETVKQESVRGAYKGMSSPLASVSGINAVIFGVQANVSKRLSNPDSLRSCAIGGATAGFVQSFIASPMELAKTRIQLQSTVAGKTVYKGPLDCLKSIYKSEGMRGVFRGQQITLLREVPGFACYFYSYEYLIRKMSGQEAPTAPMVFVSGGFAGAASWVVSCPMDVIKTRLQMDGMNGINKYNGIRHCLSTSIANEGWSCLSRGLTSCMLRAFPSNAAVFCTINQINNMAGADQDSLNDSDAWAEVIQRGEVIISASAAPVIQRTPSSVRIKQLNLSCTLFPSVAAQEVVSDPEDIWQTPDSRLD